VLFVLVAIVGAVTLLGLLPVIAAAGVIARGLLQPFGAATFGYGGPVSMSRTMGKVHMRCRPAWHTSCEECRNQDGNKAPHRDAIRLRGVLAEARQLQQNRKVVVASADLD
jgi:hypothetical protein